MLKKIVAGGQTGADRAALDASLEAGFPCRGYCPEDRQAEDGPIDPRYPLTEIEGGYAERTELNVIHSDGTVVFYEVEPTGGTLLTITMSKKFKRPHLQIDIAKLSEDAATQKLDQFILGQQIQVLNVAGPRASECPAVYRFVLKTLKPILTD